MYRREWEAGAETEGCLGWHWLPVKPDWTRWVPPSTFNSLKGGGLVFNTFGARPKRFSLWSVGFVFGQSVNVICNLHSFYWPLSPRGHAEFKWRALPLGRTQSSRCSGSNWTAEGSGKLCKSLRRMAVCQTKWKCEMPLKLKVENWPLKCALWSSSCYFTEPHILVSTQASRSHYFRTD